VNGPSVDIAVLTAKVDEYQAFYKLLERPVQWLPDDGTPSLYAWTVGTLARVNDVGAYSVVLGVTHEQTNVPATLAAFATFEQFKPRYIVFMGIAGGLDAALRKGDVLIADYVRGYEYGSVSEDGFHPRPQFQEATDLALRTSAYTFAKLNEWWKACGTLPEGCQPPVVVDGGLASGDKVIEHVDEGFFERVVKSDGWLRAIDMESAGVAALIRHLRDRGAVVGLMIVRGISDTPHSAADGGSNRDTRRQWTLWASTTAAAFLTQFIKNAFPIRPGNGGESGRTPQHQFDPLVFGGYRSHFARAHELAAVHAINNKLFRATDLVPASTLEMWWRANPLTIRLVSDEAGELVGYWNVLPFTPDAFQMMVEGRLQERNISESMIAGFNAMPKGSVYLYVTAVAAFSHRAAPVVLDLLSIVLLIEETIGIDGVAAVAVSDDALNLMATFGMKKVEGTNPSVWTLRREEVAPALRTALMHLNRLAGQVPDIPSSEAHSLRELLRRD
jgi:nucleoside phosphorylase